MKAIILRGSATWRTIKPRSKWNKSRFPFQKKEKAACVKDSRPPEKMKTEDTPNMVLSLGDSHFPYLMSSLFIFFLIYYSNLEYSNKYK